MIQNPKALLCGEVHTEEFRSRCRDKNLKFSGDFFVRENLTI